MDELKYVGILGSKVSVYKNTVRIRKLVGQKAHVHAGFINAFIAHAL